MTSISLHRISFTAVAILCSICAFAQSQSVSTGVRRGDRDTRRQQESAAPGVTERMQQFYGEADRSDADLQWMKVVYRQLDLLDGVNAALYYPEEVTDGQENMFRIIMRLLADGDISAYEYLDGREIFTDEYKVKVADMLDRFHVLYAPAKGSTERHPRYVIEESDVPCNEVLSYYILERWELDKRTNRMRTQVEAICPVLHRIGDFGGEPVKYPMFWIRMDALRPYLTQQSIFVDDDNNLPTYTYDDFFQLALYKGDIYKTRNLRNRTMMQMYPDPDDLRHAQDSIDNYLATYEDKMWVPSREDVIAAREERERIAAGDTIAARDDTRAVVDDNKARNTRAKRARKPKSPKVKQSKVKNQPAQSAVRSVRRRR